MKKIDLLFISVVLFILLTSQFAEADPQFNAFKFGQYRMDQNQVASSVDRVEQAVRDGSKDNNKRLEKAINSMDSTLRILERTYNTNAEFRSIPEYVTYVNRQKRLMAYTFQLLTSFRLGEGVLEARNTAEALFHLNNAYSLNIESWNQIKNYFSDANMHMTIQDRRNVVLKANDYLNQCQRELDMVNVILSKYTQQLSIRQQVKYDVTNMFRINL